MDNKIQSIFEELKGFTKYSDCCRVKVASALYDKSYNHIITSTNKTIIGESCESYFKGYDKNQRYFKSVHHEFAKRFEVKAETRAISWCAKNGIKTHGCIMFTTMLPSIDSVKIIHGAGIKIIYYLEEYDRELNLRENVDNLADRLNIKIIKYFLKK